MRRDPFAMLPFCGYNMSDYFQHWLDLGATLQARGATLPKIFCVNWFRKGADGKFVWPGYGENMRVLEWIVDRVEGSGAGGERPLRHHPALRGPRLDGPRFRPRPLRPGHRPRRRRWSGELALHDGLFKQLAHRLPDELPQVRRRIAARLAG